MRSTRSGRLLTSHFTVLSLRSGLRLPQPKYSCISSSTSTRSPFWLTDRLGRTSHPTTRVGRGAIETVKHPSPSTYPEMYDGRSTRDSREPASCPGLRFATARPYRQALTGPEPHPEGISRYGAIPHSRQRASHGIPPRTLSMRPL